MNPIALPRVGPAFWHGTANVGWVTFQAIDESHLIFFLGNYRVEVRSWQVGVRELMPVARGIETWLLAQTQIVSRTEWDQARPTLTRNVQPSALKIGEPIRFADQIVIPSADVRFGVLACNRRIIDDRPSIRGMVTEYVVLAPNGEIMEEIEIESAAFRASEFEAGSAPAFMIPDGAMRLIFFAIDERGRITFLSVDLNEDGDTE